MIAVAELVRLIRFKQKDNNEIKFSDYDIIQALNECIRYVNQSFAMKNSDFLEKVTTYNQDDLNAQVAVLNSQLAEGETPTALYDFALTGAELPDDFLSLVSLIRYSDNYKLIPVEAIAPVEYNTYKIVGERIYVGCGTFNMLYRASIAEISTLADNVQLPVFFKDCLAKLTGMILNNNAETDVMMQAVEDTVSALIPKRRYTNVRTKMPFYV